ncbi:hypothetical protein J4477_04260 [Candidatus Pacearchaeota archaeon]|nr:hypothetical protein [Candidatus Pacearchaeota archaeon]
MAQPLGVLLQQLADMDIFFYVLPFLLIFALVFGILEKANILGPGAGKGGNRGDNRNINAVIALAVGLLAIQFDQVPVFFSVIFPKLGIALSILLAALILVGLFVDLNRNGGPALVFFGLGAVAFVIIVLYSFQDYVWWQGGWWQDNFSALVAAGVVIAFVFLVVSSGHHDPKSPPYVMRYWDNTSPQGNG